MINTSENTDYYHLLSQNIDDVIWVYNMTQQKTTYVSPSVVDFAGISIEEAMQQTIHTDYEPESAMKLDKIILVAMQEFLKNPNQKKTYSIELQQKDKNGNYRWIENNMHFQFAQNNDIELIGVTRNIDDRKKAEIELQNYKLHLEELVKQRTEELENAQSEKIKALIHGEESERTRISQELHDGLGPLISTLQLFMQGIERVEDIAKIKIFAQNALPVFDEIVQTIKEVSNNLSPYILHDFGLNTALKTFIEKHTKRTEINFVFESHFLFRFDEIYEITLYRVITELINNSIKHSKATQITLKMEQKAKSIFVDFSDNGIGFDFENVLHQHKGLGLHNIRNRIKNIGGTIEFGKFERKGFSARITVNLKK